MMDYREEIVKTIRKIHREDVLRSIYVFAEDLLIEISGDELCLEELSNE